MKGYLQFNDFFISSFCMGLVLAFAYVKPLSILFDWSPSVSIGVFVLFLLVTIVGMFYWLFKAPIKVWVASVVVLFFMPVGLVVALPEMLVSGKDKNFLLNTGSDYLNAQYALAVFFSGALSGFWQAHKAFKNQVERRTAQVKLMGLKVDLNKHTFEDLEKTRYRLFNWLYWFWGLLGVGFLLLFVLPVSVSDVKSIQVLLVKAISVILSAFFFGFLGIFLGQAARVLAYEYRVGGPLTFINDKARLKWRHDYVKYHLPAPIRKLNLRLFNQHIDAYQRHLSEQSTRKEV